MISAQPLISVIIPVYNVEKYLRRCLDSVLAQSFGDWEAVCVNDGSPDGSQAILNEYAAQDPRFRIIVKANGGLSDARNVGMAESRGRYLMFLDSDDSIHPDTMRVARELMLRDGSDIVSWYKDPLYRPMLMLLSRLGIDIDHYPNHRTKRRYHTEQVESYVTDDVFAHIAEAGRPGQKVLIKHFYVWRHLFKREVVMDVPFIKGLTFEDFPWWSEVILKNPRVTITQLPFYYYFPNVGSIDMGSKRAKKIEHWICGLKHTYRLYHSRATEHQLQAWTRYCMWPVVIYQIARKLKQIQDTNDRDKIADQLIELDEMGVFADPPDRKAEYYTSVIHDFVHSSGRTSADKSL